MPKLTIAFGDLSYDVQVPLALDVLEEVGDEIDEFQALLPELKPYLDADQTPPVKLLAKGGRLALKALAAAINLRSPDALDYEALRTRMTLTDAIPLINGMGLALSGSGFEKANDSGEAEGGRNGAGASPSKATVRKIVARLAVDGICAGDPARIRATLSLLDVADLDEQWAEWPPARISLAIAIQWKPDRKEDRMVGDAIDEFFGTMTGGARDTG